MKNIAFLTIFIVLSSFKTFGTQLATERSNNQLITQQRWQLKKQYFASHDHTGTDRDTFNGSPFDYISFNSNGLAYFYFNGVYDTLEYKLIGKDSISFGDTPFLITGSADKIELYQHEQEQNGDYNSVRYILVNDKKDILHITKYK